MTAVDQAIPQPEPQSWPNPRYAWFVLAILVVAYAFAIVDRIAIGLLVDSIKTDIKVSDTQIGLLQGLAFAVFYSAFGFPIGVLVDRWSRVRLLSIGLSAWSLATISCGLAGNFVGLFLGRIGVGAGEASILPAASSLIADLFAPNQRGRAFGVFMFGGALGTAMAYLIGSLAIQLVAPIRTLHPWFRLLRDWQVVFFIIGIPGVVLALVLAASVREPLRRDRSAPLDRGSFEPLAALFRQNRRAYGGLMSAAILNALVVNAQFGWLPTLFVRVHHWKPKDVGASMGLVGLPCGAFSALAAGFVLSWLYRRGRLDAPIFVVMTQSAAWATLGVLGALAPSPRSVLAAYAATSCVSIWASTATLAGLSQVTPNELRGQVIALYMVAAGLVSLTLGGVSVGFLSDHVFTGRGGVSPSLAFVDASCGALSIASLIWSRRAFLASAIRAEAWTSR